MKKGYQKIVESLGQKRVRTNVSMVTQTTFKIGGPADLFYEAKTKEELIEAVRVVKELKVPYFIFGGGSNVLVSDRGIRGLVIKILGEKCQILNEEVVVEAGASLSWLVQEVAQKGLSGLEFCAGIPGTVGGAVRGNAGTKDKWLGSRVLVVEVLDEKGQVKEVAGEDCQFAYRESRFKYNQEIILSVRLKLSLDGPENIKARMSQFLKKRQNQPREPSAGSIFKNPPGFSAGQLIDKAGLKGKRIGDAQISPAHGNFIVNLKKAICEDVLKLISLAKKTVEEKFGVKLEEEIMMVGQF